MSAGAERNRLAMEREQNAIKECSAKLNDEIKKLEEETGTTFVGQIQSIGQPNIAVTWKKEPVKCFWAKKRKWNEEMSGKLQNAWKRYCELCTNHGIVAFAQITPRGAQITYALTDEKRKEIEPKIIIPETKVIAKELIK